MPERPIPDPSRPTELARLELAKFAQDAPLDRVFARACELSATALNVERVGVWLFIDDGRVLRCANLFERSKGEHSAGTVLHVADFPVYFKSLVIRKAVPAEVVASAAWAAELAGYLAPLGITSMLDAGIFVDGKLVGAVCHEHVGPPREWTTEARDFAGSVADLLALRVQSAEVRELRAAFLTQQARLATQEKATALAQLAAGVAHDFRNLLTVISGQGQLLARRKDVPAAVLEQAKTIQNATERGIALANELMAFARPADRPPGVVDLGEVARDALPVLTAAAGPPHPVRYTQPSPVGLVLIDPAQFTRLLLNLVVNAAEAMPDGGPVDVRLVPVNLTGHPAYTGQFVLLEVSDRGAGMDDATRRRVFEPYFTTKPTGTGLGLAVVRQVADRAGGLVRVESAPGGSTFRVFFPRVGTGVRTGGTQEFRLPPEPQAVEG
jgi:two-component system, cell cycle sensor histidine kinase and response regulator CckA